jgi:hypothetical protein
MTGRIRKLAVFAVVFVIVAVLMANPPRQPLKSCACGVGNEPERTSCWKCGATL